METTPHSAVLAADVVLFNQEPSGGQVHVLLIQRGWPPFEGCWALPGGHVDANETFAMAAARELTEETGLPAPGLAAVNVYDQPERDPRGRVVSVAFVGTVRGLPAPTAGDDASAARWVPLRAVLADPTGLAFDHHTILSDAARTQFWGEELP